MPVNIDNIKKLSSQEKLEIIDELLESIDKDTIEKHLIQPTSEENILRESWEQYRSGNMQFDSWENVEKRLRTAAAERQQKKDDL
jgi:hypothetical protein